MNIYKISNETHTSKYNNCLKELYSHIEYNEENHTFEKPNRKLISELYEKNKMTSTNPLINIDSLLPSIGLQPYEQIVFHGSYDKNIINSVCENGFNPATCNTAMYGHGAYFAKNFSYCNKNGFAAGLGKNIYHVFVCKITTGSYCVGSRNQKLPEMLSQTKRCKSFVNDMNNPTIFAIQDSSQIEILYEIHYSKKDDEFRYDLKEMYT